MPRHVVSTIRSLWLPFSVIVGYIIFGLFLKWLFPSVDDVFAHFQELFRDYGYMIILIGSILEAALIINFFVPGGSIILAGAFFASQGAITYPLFILVVLAGTLIGFSIDYIVGYYGWSDILNKVGMGSQLKKAEQHLNKFGTKAYFYGYIHPDLGSIYAVASGTLRVHPSKFLLNSMPSLIFWILFWTLPIYFFGSFIRQYLDQYLNIGFILIIVVFVMPKIAQKIIPKKI